MKKNFILMFLACFYLSEIQGQISLNGAAPYNGTYTLGCYSYTTTLPGFPYTITACPTPPDAGTNYYNRGRSNASYQFTSSAQIIVRKNNIWEIQTGSTNTLSSYSMSGRLYHSKYQYSTIDPPCNALWIRDSDNAEVAFFISGTSCSNTCTPAIAPTIVQGGTECIPTLTASGCAGTLWWSNGSSASTITPSANGTYQVLCDFNNDCPSNAASATISNILNAPMMPAENRNKTISCGQGINLQYVGAYCESTPLAWTDGTNVIANDSIVKPIVNTTYTATCIGETCTSTGTTMVVVINEFPVPPTSNGNKTMCTGGAFPALSVTIPENPYGGYTNYTADWFSASTGGTSIALATASYTPNSIGTFYVQTRDANSGCISSSRTAVALSQISIPETLTLASPDQDYTTTPTPSTKRANTITASNSISGSGTTVVYTAGKSITLNQGFKADHGTVFKAEMGGCQ